MYVQPLEGSVSPNSLATPAGSAGPEGSLFPGAPAPTTGDNISRFLPPTLDNGADYGGFGNSGSMQGIFGSLMGVLEQLMQMLQSLTGYGCNSPFGSGGCSSPSQPYGNERYFQNAAGSSQGDPHLSFNGARWNNMTSQPDLLNSDSFAGGYRISTQVTPANAKGVAWNQSATIALDNGATTVTMNNDGQASITSNGRSVSIGRGETLNLGNGDSVTCEENGSLRVTAQNGNGGRIETTLSAEGKGVNVDVTAHDVDLGGTLVNGYERREHGTVRGSGPPAPISGPIMGGTAPITTPISVVPPPVIGPLPQPIIGPISIPQPVLQEPEPIY